MTVDPFDLVIVGGGVAGLCAALEAPPGTTIAVVDKGEAGAGSSPLAQGGLAAAVAPDDSPDLHAKDTIVAGAGLCDVDVVYDVCAAGPDAVSWLVEHGCAFDRNDDGALHVAREGGQSVSRSVHWRDATGAEIVRALRAAVQGRSVERIRDQATWLIRDAERCIGVHTRAGRTVLGRAVLMATGGAGGLWASTTNAPGATADGTALALVAGVEVADLEFMQFHPTALAMPGAQQVLLTEALRGDGAILVNEAGERFVDELAPRHIVAKAILDQRHAFLDCRTIDDLETRFPTVVEAARRQGFDPGSEPLPVRPAAHYFIGGIASDTHGRTSMPGLFAAGECASTGMHGGNRMAGNSLLEAVVVGRRVVRRALEHEAPARGWVVAERAKTVGDPDPAIPGIMWECAGPIRDLDGLKRGAEALSQLPASPHRLLASMIIEAATAREETRGVHIRTDHPSTESGLARRAFARAPGAWQAWDSEENERRRDERGRT